MARWWRRLVAEAAANVHLLDDPSGWEQEFVAGLQQQVGIELDQRAILNGLIVRMRVAAGYQEPPPLLVPYKLRDPATIPPRKRGAGS